MVNPAAGPPDAGEVVLHLLAAAVHASDAIDRLAAFAADHHTGDPSALANVADAITTMTRVRARLIRDADTATVTGHLRSLTS